MELVSLNFLRSFLFYQDRTWMKIGTHNKVSLEPTSNNCFTWLNTHINMVKGSGAWVGSQSVLGQCRSWVTSSEKVHWEQWRKVVVHVVRTMEGRLINTDTSDSIGLAVSSNGDSMGKRSCTCHVKWRSRWVGNELQWKLVLTALGLRIWSSCPIQCTAQSTGFTIWTSGWNAYVSHCQGWLAAKTVGTGLELKGIITLELC